MLVKKKNPTPSKQDKGLAASLPPYHGLFLECAAMPLPGIAERSELT